MTNDETKRFQAIANLKKSDSDIRGGKRKRLREKENWQVSVGGTPKADDSERRRRKLNETTLFSVDQILSAIELSS